MTDIADLERRVIALEAAQKETAETQTWMAQTLGRIAAVQDEHTRRLDRVETEVKGLRSDMPSIVADAMREVLKSNQ